MCLLLMLWIFLDIIPSSPRENFGNSDKLTNYGYKLFDKDVFNDF